MQYAKVLVAVPFHDSKKYCIKQLLKKIDSLTFANKEVVMRFDPGEYGGENNVKRQREYFRKLALEGDFTHLYFLGADTLPPDDVLERLLTYDKGIVGGVYWGRHGAENGTSQSAVAWIHGNSPEQNKEIFLERNKLIQIDGMGMDCVLFKREVLEKVSWMDWVQNDDDYPYYDLAKTFGYNCYIDTNIQCKHYFDNNSYTYLAKVEKDKN